ncbi:MAG: F0F1 ATP synthase subunit epsilon [Patescibacteria group bacterium]
MSAQTFHLTVASVGEAVFNDDAISVTLPGTEGVLTILAHHEPFVAALRDGSARIVQADGVHKDIAVHGGIVEVSDNKVAILL